ncbi:MAG TPA: heat-inducible transcriptional repressor HrcA [Ignavibacteria bacterium]|jgi:heat-inducible transcriptional repressor
MSDILSHREKEVLRYIVENFVKSALPVGSRSISKQTDLNLSSATIRNVMSDLEEMELLSTPHTSAGRIPTDKGYRFYVNSLMAKDNLSESEIAFLKSQIEEIKSGVPGSDDIYIETSKILGKISHQLAVVSQPFLKSGILEKLDIIRLSSNKILVVINIKSGFVKTVILEIDSDISKAKVDKLSAFLNEKLKGLTLKVIRETFEDRVKDYQSQNPELVQMFINSIDELYDEGDKGNKIYIGGTGEVIMQPEFDDPKNFRNIIELTEDKNLVLHIFQNLEEEKVSVSIGNENPDLKLKDYSIICSNYNIGEIHGNIGILGPKRMNYSKMISLIEYTSKLISELYTKS